MPELTLQEKKYLPQLESLLLKGVGADRAFDKLREFHGIVRGQPSPIRRSVVREIARIYRQNIAESVSLFPQTRSQRFTTKMAVPSSFVSPVGHRYLIDYTVKVRNTITGEVTTRGFTLGARRLDRMGVFLDNIDYFLDQFNQPDNERYLGQFEIADKSTVRIERLIRTLNK